MVSIKQPTPSAVSASGRTLDPTVGKGVRPLVWDIEGHISSYFITLIFCYL
jgi:hypothetical protein